MVVSIGYVVVDDQARRAGTSTGWMGMGSRIRGWADTGDQSTRGSDG
jgi:hypothetical protein